MISSIRVLTACLVLCAALPVRAREANGMTSTDISVEATSEKTTASFKVGKSWVFVPPLTEKYEKTLDLSLSASTPFDQDKSRRKDLGDISGLTTGTNAKLQGGLMWWARVNRDAVFMIDETCSKAVQDLYEPEWGTQNYSFAWPRDNPVEQTETESALLFQNQGVQCDKMLSSDDGMKAAVDTVNTANKTHKDFKLPPVRLKKRPAHSREWHWRELQAVQQKVQHASQGMTFTITANRQELDYADAAAPATINEVSKYGYGASLGYTLILHQSVLLAAVSYEQVYQGGEDTQICSPIGTTGSFMCQNAALSAPAEKEDEILSVEYRTIIPWHISIAIAPRVQYSFQQSQFGVRLPIYVAPDPKHVLDGGIAFAWTEEDHFGVSIFVSKAFKFFD